MHGNLFPAMMVFWPIIAALLFYYPGKERPQRRSALVIFTALSELLLTLFALATAFGSACSLSVFGMDFELDGFRAIYTLVVSFMWAMTALFSPEYFQHYHNRSRYYFFFLITLGATQGVFLSADLRTTLLFFEVMSFTSYPWVAHEENPQALRAASTYLGIAVIGGLSALMGLFLLSHALGTLRIDALYDAAIALEDKKILYIAAACLLVGFGAKAGMFPLHIWLPKAHPVAPAPASALLSGVLTKTGIFGVLVISCDILRHDAAWGYALLVLAVITMVLGAVMALFSIDLKRTLACSSMSQIGFILVGIAMQCLLGEENALAANGTILHMLNHSLIKLDLFMVAGVVYMNTHRLDLNDIRGWGKGKPLLHIAFLLGLLGIGGIPGFNGYISKTLLHEAIVEFAHLSHNPWITLVEWLFLISGGITLTYMTKLYLCIFHEGKKPEEQNRPYMNRLSAFAILTSALLLPVLGLFPHAAQDRLAALAAPFMHAAPPAHAVHYFAWVNLKGAVISLGIAVVLYLVVVRKMLIKTVGSEKRYFNPIPEAFDLENALYRPLLLKWLPSFFGAVSAIFGENKVLIPLCRRGFTALKTLFAVFCSLPDGLLYLLRMSIYRDSPLPHQHKRFAFAHNLGTFIDSLLRSLHLPPRRGKSYSEVLTDAANTLSETTRGITGTFSFALLMAFIGICSAIIYLLTKG